VPIGSAGISILPFGNGAERMLNNRATGCGIHGVDFNRHCLSLPVLCNGLSVRNRKIVCHSARF
ncbi:hypothetical protein, partial [Bacteroides fragilis]|uniref:hypothetical protein n=1 Tax=Bacteroides fragilis TaxID=817 RepID=UPI0012D84B7D